MAEVQEEDEEDDQEERESDDDDDVEEWQTSTQFSNEDDNINGNDNKNDSDEPMTVRLSEEVLGKLASSLDESGDLDTAVFTVEASADGASPQQSLPFSELMARFNRLKESAPTGATAASTPYPSPTSNSDTIKQQRPRASLRFLNAQGESVGFGWARDTATQRLVEVSGSGQAAAAGVQVGWRVVAVDGKPVTNNDSFEAAVTSARAKGNNSVDFEFEVPSSVETTKDVEVARQKAASDAARDTGIVAAAMLEEASQPGYQENSSRNGSRSQWETPTYGAQAKARGEAPHPNSSAETLASRTLEALRILTASGQLTGREKAKLVTSMVQAKAANAGFEDSASQLPSLVEVGFVVLVDGINDGSGTYAEGMADFAVYCRSLVD